MRVEIKAYGKGKSASIAKAVGEVRLRADSEGDAEFLKSLSDAIQRADMLSVLLELSDALIGKRMTKEDKKALADIVERCAAANAISTVFKVVDGQKGSSS